MQIELLICDKLDICSTCQKESYLTMNYFMRRFGINLDFWFSETRSDCDMNYTGFSLQGIRFLLFVAPFLSTIDIQSN